MPKQIVFNVSGIEGDAFDTAEIVFPDELGGAVGEGNDMVVRKKPGRTTSHQIVLTPGEQIPEPERSIDVTINLYDEHRSLVASGTDSVSPAGAPTVDKALRLMGRMLETIEEIQGTLDGCGSDVCAQVLKHSFARHSMTEKAMSAVQSDDWGTATELLQSVKGVVEDDIKRLEAAPDSTVHSGVLALEQELLKETTAALGVMPGDNTK